MPQSGYHFTVEMRSKRSCCTYLHDEYACLECILSPERDLKRDFTTVETSCWHDRSSQEGIQRLIEEGESCSVRRKGSFIANGIGCPLSPTYVYLKYIIRDICSMVKIGKISNNGSCFMRFMFTL